MPLSNGTVDARDLVDMEAELSGGARCAVTVPVGVRSSGRDAAVAHVELAVNASVLPLNAIREDVEDAGVENVAPVVGVVGCELWYGYGCVGGWVCGCGCGLGGVSNERNVERDRVTLPMVGQEP